VAINRQVHYRIEEFLTLNEYEIKALKVHEENEAQKYLNNFFVLYRNFSVAFTLLNLKLIFPYLNIM